MKPKIAYLIHTPYNKRDYKRFGTKILRDRGHEVEIWDFTGILESIKKIGEVRDSYQDVNQITYADPISIKQWISKVSQLTIVVTILPLSCETAFIYKAMNKNKHVQYISLRLGYVTFCGASLWFRILRKSTKDILNSISLRLLEKKHFKPLAILDSRENREKNIIPSHTLDYNIYLDSLSSQLGEEHGRGLGEYALFIDSGEPGYYHQDLIIHGIKEFISPENYFREINEYFDFFEKRYSIPVIVAVHPRVKYNGSEYNNRKMIQDDSFNLIKGAKIVISHYSTSLNMAVMLRKPVVCLKFSENYRECENKHYPSTWVDALHLENVVTLGEEKSFDMGDDIYRVNEEKYQSYLDKYIKYPGSPDINTWEYLSMWLDQNIDVVLSK